MAANSETTSIAARLEAEEDSAAAETTKHVIEFSEEQRSGRSTVPQSWLKLQSWWLLSAIAVIAFALALAGGRHGIGTRLADAVALFPSGTFPSEAARHDRHPLFIAAQYLAPII